MFVFFFQAEDGIRDYKVTGVQTCALPIYREGRMRGHRREVVVSSARFLKFHRQGTVRAACDDAELKIEPMCHHLAEVTQFVGRSEERRVGKRCRSQWCRMV